jgi:hypothetical protein
MKNGMRVVIVTAICAALHAIPTVAQSSQDAWTAQLSFNKLHRSCAAGEILVAINGAMGICMESTLRDGGAPAIFEVARKTCIEDGKRLPEPFEYKYACQNVIGFSDMPTSIPDGEWGSNFTSFLFDPDVGHFAAGSVFGTLVGYGSCWYQNYGGTGGWNSATSVGHPFRCVS